MVPFAQVDIGLFADQIGISSTNTLDLGQGVHDLLLAIDVGIEKAKNELDYTRVRLEGGQMSRCLVNVQFDFSPETSATFRLASHMSSTARPLHRDSATADGK